MINKESWMPVFVPLMAMIFILLSVVLFWGVSFPPSAWALVSEVYRLQYYDVYRYEGGSFVYVRQAIFSTNQDGMYLDVKPDGPRCVIAIPPVAPFEGCVVIKLVRSDMVIIFALPDGSTRKWVRTQTNGLIDWREDLTDDEMDWRKTFDVAIYCSYGRMKITMSSFTGEITRVVSYCRIK